MDHTNANIAEQSSPQDPIQPPQHAQEKKKLKRKHSKKEQQFMQIKRQKIEEIPVEKRGERPRDGPKKKVAVLVGYAGKNYAGLQRNPGSKTIESELEAAIVRAGGISKENAGSFAKVGWANCARTDKGVSAAANVIALKAILCPNLLEKINSELPSDIRVWGIYRVSKSFNPKNKVSYRKYSYIVPTYIFAPSAVNSKYSKESEFKFDESTRENISEILQSFVGSNNYHNFTAKSGPTSYDDASAIRIITSFECSAPFTIDDVQFVELTVVGQSFVMYQIRKMVGLTIALVRDGASRHIVNACFQKPRKRIPTAPAEFLFLRECLFDFYNKSCAPPNEPLDWGSVRGKIDNFVQTVITPNIFNACKADRVFEKWVSELEEHPINYERLKITFEDSKMEEQPEDIGEELQEEEGDKDD